jgi:uncharacterized membrane protein
MHTNTLHLSMYFSVHLSEGHVTLTGCCSGAAASAYLLHVGLNVMRNVCPICMAAHAVNFTLVWLAWMYSEHVRAAPLNLLI